MRPIDGRNLQSETLRRKDVERSDAADGRRVGCRCPGRARADRFGDLVGRYQGKLVNYLYRMLHNEDDAHDLAQEVFVKIHGALDRFDPRYRFSTWLFRVAQNAAIDTIRKRRLKVVSLHREDDDGESTEIEVASGSPSPYQSMHNVERGSGDPPGDRRAALGVQRADRLAALWRAVLRGHRQNEGHAARHGEEQAVSGPADAQGTPARPT